MSATLIHHGHTRLLSRAAEIGRVIVALTTDEEVKGKKGYLPELNFEQRKEILLSLSSVSEVIPSKWKISEDFMNEHGADFLIHGDDNSNPIPIHRLIMFERTEDISSSELRRRAAEIYQSSSSGIIPKAVKS